MNTQLPILFEDGEALVIDKPAGLPIDPPRNGGLSLEMRNNGRERLRLHLLDEAAQQAAVGGVSSGAAQALAGQHGALVVGGFGQ